MNAKQLTEALKALHPDDLAAVLCDGLRHFAWVKEGAISDAADTLLTDAADWLATYCNDADEAAANDPYYDLGPSSRRRREPTYAESVYYDHRRAIGAA